MKKEKVLNSIIGLLIVYLGVNIYLLLTNSPLCSSSGCSLASSLLKFDSIYLYILGLIASICLLIFNLTKMNMLFRYTILSMIVSETILLSFLYFKTGEMCYTCLGFWSILFIIFCLYRFSLYNFVLIIPIVIAISLLSLKVDNIEEGYTIIGKEGCHFCVETKEELNKMNINYKYKDYKGFMDMINSMGINNIPIMIHKKEGMIQIYVGKENIINSFGKYDFKDFDTFNAVSPIEGCKLDYKKESECKQ